MLKDCSKGIKISAVKVVCAALALGLLSACGDSGGGGIPVDNSKYSGVSARADITLANAVAFTSDAYAAGSIGASQNLIGVMVKADADVCTLPEIATLLQKSATVGMAQQSGAPVLTGVATTQTIYGAAGGSYSLSWDRDQATGNFSGKVTYSNYKAVTSGPTISGTVTMTGAYNDSTARYESITMVFSPLSVTSESNTANLYGSFAFSTEGASQMLRISCTMHVNPGKCYWIKDWTYNFSSGKLTVTGVYYHPSYGYVEMTTPTPLTTTSLSGMPTAGVFQAAGGHCTKGRMTFSAAGSIVTACVEGSTEWLACTE